MPAASELACLMKTVPRAAIPRLLSSAQAFDYRPGDVVLEAGQQRSPALVVSGVLRIVIRSNDGRVATISYLGSGRIFGVPTLFGSLPVSVVAHKASTVIHFDAEEVARLASDTAEFGWALLKATSENAIVMPDAVAKFAFKTVQQRVADNLLWSSSLVPSHQGAPVARLTQQEIADAVGSVREVVARALRNLKSKGLIKLTPRGVVILDEVGLNKQSV